MDRIATSPAGAGFQKSIVSSVDAHKSHGPPLSWKRMNGSGVLV